MTDFLTSGIQEEFVHFAFIFPSQFNLIGLVWLGQVDPANQTDIADIGLSNTTTNE